MKQRQSEPHAHSVRFTADNSKLLAADLGTDDVFVYDVVDGSLRDSNLKSLRVKAGSGPRHFVFSPDGKHVVVVGELNGLVSVFDAKLQNRGPLSATFAVRAEDQRKLGAPRSCFIRSCQWCIPVTEVRTKSLG